MGTDRSARRVDLGGSDREIVEAASDKEDHRHADIFPLGIDWARATFHLVAFGTAGKVLVRKKFTQRRLTDAVNIQTSLIGQEACSGVHFLGRALRKQTQVAGKATDRGVAMD